jgi:mannitol/fructose-specific phosphotransferase system IIA component (Ntr-type)
MKLSNKLKTHNIIFPLQSDDRSSAIQEMLDRLLELDYLTGTVKLYTFIDEKDKLINSAVGRGTAYHYSTSVEINEQLAVFGFSPSGIDYNSPDGQRVHFILLILDTKEELNLHRKLVTRFQHFINDLNYREKVIDCQSDDELSDLINNWEEQYLLNEDF